MALEPTTASLDGARAGSDPPPSMRRRTAKARRPGAAYRSRGVGRWRFVRAYSTTFRVIFSYLWLALLGRVRGAEYREARLAATHRRNARLVERTILSLQGLFIKVGQALSIMANFLPEAFRAELEGLQDQVPPRPFREVAPRIESELGKPLAELFAELDEEPVASASLGQVHRAVLHDGRVVAVKVQHQDIDEIVRLDLKTIRRIMGIVQWFVPVQGLDSYYHQIKEMLSRELDFAREAQSILRVAANFDDDARVLFPTPIEGMWTERVLVQTWLDGVKIGDLAALDEMGIDRRELASRLVRAFCQMIFVDGVYHADPHPGNVLVDEHGNLVLLDFGAVGELSPAMRSGIPEFLEGVLRRDTERLIRALRKMGFLSRTSDDAVSERIIEYFHGKFQEEVKLESFNLKDIKIDPQRGLENLLDLRKMDVGLRELSGAFHIPRDWVLLERTILLVFGCCSQLDPELEPVKIIQPYLQEFVLGDRDWQTLAVETLRDMALVAITLPQDLRKVLTRANRGELEVRVRGLAEGARAIHAVGRQLGYIAISVATGAAAMHFHERGAGRPFRAFAMVSVLAALAYLASSLRGGARMR